MIKPRQRIWQIIASLLLAAPLLSFADDNIIRFATFNIAMGLETRGELIKRLESGDDEGLKKAAAIIQQIDPDVLLINEFDWYQLDSALLFINNYLNKHPADNGQSDYLHGLNGAVNTGMNSGLDMDSNGKLDEPQDAWGFGRFPGQFAMAVFSRYPLTLERSFRMFKWSDMPDAMQSSNPDGSNWYPEPVYKQLRLSSKNHWDIHVDIDGQSVHFLVSHPTPPVFDGPDDHNGARNHDEIRLWADYIDPARAGYIYDDSGKKGGLAAGAKFVIAGDLNADPVDGASRNHAVNQLLQHPLINASCVPVSEGAVEANEKLGGKNLDHKGNPAADTGQFNSEYAGNMRVDYVLPSANMKVVGCGVFWPEEGEVGHEWIDVSDHRLVWVDVEL